MRVFVTMAMVLGLAACGGGSSDEVQTRGVGFDDYNEYLADQKRREAELSGRRAARVTSTTAPASQPAAQSDEQRLANDALTAIGQTPRGQDASAVLVAGPGSDGTAPRRSAGAAPAPNSNNSALSDEQDFNAVSNRQTIESDAQRRQQQSAQYRVIQPQALPQRPRNAAPTPIEFALQTQHNPGQNAYRRNGKEASAARACAKFSTADRAQDAFLKAGGPKRDRLKLDPNGDGFVCGWSPLPYRNLGR